MPAFPDPYAHDPAMTDQSATAHLPARRGWRLLGVQLAALVVISIIFTVFDLDLKIAGLFYSADGGWYLARKPLWVWLHRYGTIPGLVLTLTALIGWGAGFFLHRLKPLRRSCMIVALTSIIAAGLLVNAVFKQYWGRPRPDQTIEFGGQWRYRHILPPGIPGKGASFPCGHCTMGFVFLSMMAFHRQNKYLAYGGTSVGIVLGLLLSAARVVQGAHFVSDTLWSLGFITMTATALCMLPLGHRTMTYPASAPATVRSRRLLISFLVILVLGLVGTGFLTRRPFYKTQDYLLDVGPEIEQIEIQINTEPGRINLRYAEQSTARLQVDVHGFGWIKFNFHMHFDPVVHQKTLRLILYSDPRSYFAELDHALTLILPMEAKDRIKVLFDGTVLVPSTADMSDQRSSHKLFGVPWERRA
jgi:membrane-associated PAP2 superfamily phosphatase